VKSTMSKFADQYDLINHAKGFIKTRMDALEKDVEHCVKTKPYAPFPALIYCFSNIDLLGALYGGRADTSAPTTQRSKKYSSTQQSKRYMMDFMGYNEEQSTLLQCIFRHKLVHLAEPLLSVIEFKSRLIAWKYNHYNTVNHLIFVPAITTNNKIQITANWEIQFDEIFEVSILGLAKDIINSVYKTNGYIESLQKDSALQSHFENAIEDIHSMIKISVNLNGVMKC
jgi:hypothetical protein